MNAVLSYLKGTCGVSNNSVSEKCDVRTCVKHMKCGVSEWLKRNTLRWFGCMERMRNEDCVKKCVIVK